MTVAVIASRPGAAARSRAAKPFAGGAGTARGLTRRGWTVVVMAVVGLAVAAFRAGAATAEGRYIPTEAVVVKSGDTLWSIAEAVAGPGEDVQGVVVQLQRLNQLPDSRLQVGDVLEVPRE
ncbi:MAG: LysM peptidoglycan-binding domain-containing protein [Bifidobacteriaceae bacterium]|jgi:nucleoid-associated protein YgaU|nr:LysM peptidoglycan-binding domain-containing protein [Bifidobacteriaceae bacterium]